MNVPPECDYASNETIPCNDHVGPVVIPHLWSVFNKTIGKRFTVCARHLSLVLKPESTLVLCPAKDYSKKS